LGSRHQRCRMFGRRKHSPQEDEPLVPHGLIWQATDEPEAVTEQPAGMNSSAVPIEKPVRQAVPGLEMPKRQPESNTEASTPLRTDLPSHTLGAISPPIPWPSPKTASVIRRSQHADTDQPTSAPPTKFVNPPLQNPIANTRPWPKPTETSPQLPNEKSAPTKSPQVLHREIEVIELEGADEAPEKSARRTAILQPALSRIAIGVGEIGQTMARVLARMQRGWSATAPRLQAFVNRTQPFARKCASGAASGFRLGSQRLRSSLTSTVPPVVNGLARARTFSSSTFAESQTRAVEFARRVRNQRIRIRISKSARVQDLILRSRMALTAHKERFRRDQRLWTSMAMAGLSALLTLAVISGVSHYAPGADASRKDLPTATQSSNPSAVIAPNIKRSKPAAGVSRSHHVQISHAKPAPTHNRPRTVAHRVRRSNEEADYVAPDTYHYYGQSR